MPVAQNLKKFSLIFNVRRGAKGGNKHDNRGSDSSCEDKKSRTAYTFLRRASVLFMKERAPGEKRFFPGGPQGLTFRVTTKKTSW